MVAELQEQKFLDQVQLFQVLHLQVAVAVVMLDHQEAVFQVDLVVVDLMKAEDCLQELVELVTHQVQYQVKVIMVEVELLEHLVELQVEEEQGQLVQMLIQLPHLVHQELMVEMDLHLQ